MRELSEIAMTGAAWITEHELHHIVNRVRELEAEIKDLNTELTLTHARNQLNLLPGDNMIHDEAEIRRLYAIAREARERIKVLEAERDLQHDRAEAYHNEAVKYRDQVKNLSHLLEKMAERNQNLEHLRTRNAELVKEVVDTDWG